MNSPMMSVEAVDKWYGAAHVLKNCNLTIERGEVVVVCGPSGSGKSTLIKCINGLEGIQKGRILVDDVSVGDPKTDLPKLRARIGMVFQHFELYPHRTALGNDTLALPKDAGRTRDDAEAAGMAALDRVGLAA